jgi:hypothetical protein
VTSADPQAPRRRRGRDDARPSSKCDAEALQTLETVVDQPLRITDRDGLNTLNHLFEKCLHLEFRQVHADARVSAESPSEIGAAPFEVEAQRVGKLPFVGVGRGEDQRTRSPARIVTPPTSASRDSIRVKSLTGEANRTASMMA